MGWPLTTKEYGGAWIYGGKDNVVSLGFVTGLDYPDPRTRSAARVAGIQEASVRREAARRRQDDPLRREVDALRRLVGDSAGRGQWLDDSRRLRRLPEFAAAERNSSRHQERHARRRNCLRSAEERRFLRRDAQANFRNASNPAGSRKNSGRSATSIRASSTDSRRHVPRRPAAVHRRPRPARTAIQRTPDTST